LEVLEKKIGRGPEASGEKFLRLNSYKEQDYLE
jgi:hypothetical protein